MKRLFILLSFACISAFGQATSSLRGNVKDASGAVIANAVVTLTDTSTGTSREVASDASGVYQILQIAPGTYALKVEKPGFSVLTKGNVVLEVNTPATVDCVLEVGAVGTSVNVEADAALVNTVDATVGNAFEEKQVRELPLQTRNVVELLSIQPGVTQTGEVLGARRDQNNVTLDGVDVNNNQTSGITSALTNGSQFSTSGTTGQTGNTPGFNAALPVPLDSVEEFRVTVAGQTADEGRSSGGQVTLVTKSGTNNLHGSLYEYNRNTLLAADDFFNNQAGVPRTPLVRNQFGASLGGPIKKDRLFLFANWERRIDASSTPETAAVPSATLRQGELLAALSNGSVQTFTPSQVAAIDPLNIGVNPAMKTYMNSLPMGNDPALGLDQNLNFDGLRFNAPLDLDQSAYVAKLDYNIDSSGKHKLSVRGTLNDAMQDLQAAPLPGGAPAQVLLDNSKGLAATYTWIAKPDLINTVRYGITRLGLNMSGATGTALTFQNITSPENYMYRPSVQIMPTHTLGDDLTWTKGKHTISTGINFRFIRNTHTNFINSYPSYSFSRNTLGGLGGDATTDVTNYVNQLLGTSGLKLTQPTAVQDGLGDLLGLINEYTATYQYTKTGSILSFGTPAAREYAVNSYESYIMDSWRVRRDLTVTAGLRYSNSSPPWEVNGTEVVTTVPLQTYFAERVAAMNAGIPNNQIQDGSLTYTLGGAANGKRGWYGRDNLDLGPRVSIAYAPEGTGNWISKLMGKGSVLRGGFAIVYDQYGNDMAFNIDQSGSPGLASTVTQPINTNFTTSQRYTGGLSGLPALPAAAPGGFPFTPPTITGGFDEGVGVVSNLKAPYSYVFNVNYAKPLPGKLSLELGYAGRLYRRGLVQQDFDQPMTNFLDTKSGTTWSQAVGVLHNDYLAAGQNYGPIANVPFIENMFPALANAFVPGSATQNYYYGWAVINGLSDEDNLNLMDRQRISGTNKCYSVTGCNTFYPLQFAGLPTWTNAAYADYNALTVTLRRALSSSFAFDFNYTWSHSIDNSSGAESGAGTSGAVLQDAFNVNAFRGSSDFDERHNITADALYQLPFGRNKFLGRNTSKLVDEIIGGWQLSTIFRYHSGLPSTISAGGVYPTNYEISALANLLPGATNNFGQFIDNNGVPSMFKNTAAAGNYFQQSGGTTGTRAIVRLPGIQNIDIALMKTFALPWEGHRLSLRGEAFNAFNNVNLYNPILDINNTGQFGEFQSAMPARVMQLSLRYAF